MSSPFIKYLGTLQPRANGIPVVLGKNFTYDNPTTRDIQHVLCAYQFYCEDNNMTHLDIENLNIIVNKFECTDGPQEDDCLNVEYILSDERSDTTCFEMVFTVRHLPAEYDTDEDITHDHTGETTHTEVRYVSKWSDKYEIVSASYSS